jgi:hypothetical protein
MTVSAFVAFVFHLSYLSWHLCLPCPSRFSRAHQPPFRLVGLEVGIATGTIGLFTQLSF